MLVRGGVAQIGAVPFDVQATVQKTQSWFAKAGVAGCRIVVFPEALIEEETLLTADLDLDALARAKFDFDVAGHYARPDVLSLTVNEAALNSVTTKGTSPK